MNCCYLFTSNAKDPENLGYYEKLLYKSLITLLMFYSNDIENIYILIDNNISEDLLNTIKNNLKKINNTSVNIIIKLVDLNITNCIKYPKNNANSGRINRIGLLKFFIPYLVDCDNILYIDCDILFNENILNDIYKGFDYNKTLYKIFVFGWNSGLILFNCNEWRKNKTLFNDIIEYYEINHETLSLVDNCTFQYLSIESEKYKDLIVKDDNWKIGFSLEKPEWYTDVSDEEYHWSNMNIIHVAGYLDLKDKYFDKIYNWILETHKDSIKLNYKF